MLHTDSYREGGRWILPALFFLLFAIGCTEKRTKMPPPVLSSSYQAAPDTSRLRGKSAADIRGILGEPPVLARLTLAHPPERREAWVYFPYPQDPTGLHLFLRNDTVVSVHMDEFAGICSPLIQHWLTP